MSLMWCLTPQVPDEFNAVIADPIVNRFRYGMSLMWFGLYMILPLPILYGVWHKKEGSVEGVYRAIVVQ